MTKFLSSPMPMNENVIEKQIVSFMQSRNWRPTRNHVGLFARVNGTGKVKVGMEGFPDWTFTRGAEGYGMVELLHCEVKAPGKKPSPKQIEVMASLNHLGELSVWADTLDNFKAQYAQYFHD